MVRRASQPHTKGRIRMINGILYNNNGALEATLSHSYQVQGVSRWRKGFSGSCKRSSKLTPDPSVLILLFFLVAIHIPERPGRSHKTDD